MKNTLALALVVVGLVACGVPGQSDADVANRDDVPFGLLDPDPPTTTTRPTGIEVELYFVGSDGLLRPVPRSVDRTPSLTQLVRQLSDAPETLFLRTALAEALVGNVELQGGIARVDLGSEFTTLPTSDQVLALGQIVYTITARPGIGQVEFRLDGVPVPTPRGDGTVTTDSLSRDAYVNLLAP